MGFQPRHHAQLHAPGEGGGAVMPVIMHQRRGGFTCLQQSHFRPSLMNYYTTAPAAVRPETKRVPAAACWQNRIKPYLHAMPHCSAGNDMVWPRDQARGGRGRVGKPNITDVVPFPAICRS